MEDHFRPQRTERRPARDGALPGRDDPATGQAWEGEGVGEHRPAGGSRQRADAGGIASGRPAAGDHDAAPGGADLGEEPRDGGLGRVVAGDDVVPGTPPGPTGRNFVRDAAERLAERQVGVHGTRSPGAAARLGDQPARERTPVPATVDVGHPRVGEETGGSPVEVLLVDRLRGADVASLGRTVRRADDERHAGEVGLDDGRVELDRRGAARHDDDDGTRRGEGEPDREEPRRALVEPDVDPDAVVAAEPERERARTRPRSDHRVGDAGARPLVDERRREARL